MGEWSVSKAWGSIFPPNAAVLEAGVLEALPRALGRNRVY